MPDGRGKAGLGFEALLRKLGSARRWIMRSLATFMEARARARVWGGAAQTRDLPLLST
jgi:hypothetical protein